MTVEWSGLCLFFSFNVILFWPRGMQDLASPTRDHTHVSYIGSNPLDHQGSPWI